MSGDLGGLGEFLPPIALRMIGDATSLKSALGESQAAVDKFTSTSTSRLDTLIKRYSTFGLAVGGVMTGAGFAMVQFGSKAEEARLILEQSLTNAGFSIDAYSSKIDDVIRQMERYGYSNDVAMTALDRLVNATKNPDTAITDLGIAADIAANRHWDLTTAATQLARALSGSPLIFRQFGINVSDMGKVAKQAAKDQTDAAKAHDTYTAAVRRYNDMMDVWKSKAKHSEAEYLALKNAALGVAKAQAEYKAKQDAANASAAQAASSQQRIQEAVDQTAKKVHGDAAAISNTFMGTIEGWKEIVGGFFSNLSNSVGPAITSIGAVLTVTSGLVDSIQGSVIFVETYRARTAAAAAATEELQAAMALEATTAQDLAAKDELVAAAQTQVGNTAIGATGKIGVLIGKIGAVIGIAALAGDALAHAWSTADPSVNSNTKDMQKLLVQIGRTGQGIDRLGFQIHGIGTATYDFNDALGAVADSHWWDELNQKGTDFINNTFGTNLDNSLTRAQQSIDAVDQGLAALVTSGNAPAAEAAFQRIADAAYQAGHGIDYVTSQLPGYEAAMSAMFAANAAASARNPLGTPYGEHSGQRIKSLVGYTPPKFKMPKFPGFKMPPLPNYDPKAEAALAKHQAAVNKAQAAAAAAAAKIKASIDSVTKGLTDSVDKSRTALQQLTQAASQMASSVADSIRKYATVTAALPTPWANVASNISAQMRMRAQDVQTFYANVTALRAQGLNATSLQDIISAGVQTGGQTAAALVGHGSDIASINASQAQINSYAQQVGDTSAQIQYAAQIDVARKHLATSEAMLALWKKELASQKQHGDIKITVQGSVLSEKQLWQIVQTYANRYWGRNGQAGTKA